MMQYKKSVGTFYVTGVDRWQKSFSGNHRVSIIELLSHMCAADTLRNQLIIWVQTTRSVYVEFWNYLEKKRLDFGFHKITGFNRSHSLLSNDHMTLMTVV